MLQARGRWRAFRLGGTLAVDSVRGDSPRLGAASWLKSLGFWPRYSARSGAFSNSPQSPSYG